MALSLSLSIVPVSTNLLPRLPQLTGRTTPSDGITASSSEDTCVRPDSCALSDCNELPVFLGLVVYIQVPARIIAAIRMLVESWESFFCSGASFSFSSVLVFVYQFCQQFFSGCADFSEHIKVFRFLCFSAREEEMLLEANKVHYRKT